VKNMSEVYMKRFALSLAALALVAACGGGTATNSLVPASPTPGLGVISFGTGVNPTTLLITTPETSFAVTNAAISWSAQLSETAGATSLTLIFAAVSATGTETGAIQQNMPVSNPGFTIFANTSDLPTIVGGKPGTYVMRILRDAKILAEGKFTLTATP
jgi:hypothetical protein